MTADDATHQNGTGKHHGKKNKHNKAENSTEEQPIIIPDPEEATTIPLPKFAERISTFPILVDGVTAVHGYVNQNSLGSYALNVAGSTLTTVNKLTQPYQKRLQGPLEKVDTLGCRSLEIFEQRFPLMKQPTMEIIEAVKTPPMKVYDGVKTKIDTTITAPATSLAKGVNDRVSVVVDNVEAVVDKWLPAEGEHAHADEANQATRVYRLSLDVSNRIIHRVNLHLEKHHVPRSREDIVKLAETNALLKSAFDKIHTLNETLNQWVLLSAQAAKERLPSSVTQRVTDLTVTVQTQYREITSKSLSDLFAELVKQLDGISEYIKIHSSALPVFIQQSLEPLIRFANTEYEIIRSQAIRKDATTIEKARQIVSLNQDQVLPTLQSSILDVQEQLRYYTEVATQSKDKVVVQVKTRLQAFGVSV